MARIDSLHTLLVEQLKDIYDAEKRLTKALPKMARKASSEELSTALETHLDETQEQIRRLEQAFEHLEERAKGKPCAGMRGILEEGDEHVGEDYDDDGLRDAVIIGSAQRVEHYEMAAYGTAIAHARLLGLTDVVDLLETTLEEEKAADQKLTQIAEGMVNPDAASEDDEDEEQESVGRGRGVMAGAGVMAGRGGSSNGRGASRAGNTGRGRGASSGRGGGSRSKGARKR
jgi:ferritin-like metal-binding protein YciE